MGDTLVPEPVDVNEVTVGGEKKTSVVDVNLTDLMSEILAQLRVMNAHLEKMSGEHFDESEVL